MKLVKNAVLSVFLIGLLSGAALAEERAIKEYKAVRTGEAPKMDGRLDDPCWATAPPETSFTQTYPDERKPPTERTEFRVLYDNANLYIGVRANDKNPKGIVGRLARRDQAPESEWIQIDLDPYHDHLTGLKLVVNPAGTKIDGAYYNDILEDWSWDGVWEAGTSKDSLGWSAEFRIPFSILRFKPGPDLTFGLNVCRSVERRKEWEAWVPIYHGESGWVSRAGHLTGLSGIARPRNLELLPYTVSRLDSKPKDPLTNPKGTSFAQRLGLDLKYGLASNLILDATVNPDFGQVEADPMVLNLSAYETFYTEKRPFFLEGASSFITPITLFYSRRIGKALSEGETEYDVNYDTDVIKTFPEYATILGAGKLTGKVGNVSLGLLDGVTDEAHATVDSSGTERRRLVEPLSNYFVGRTKADFGSSSLGIFGTGVSRKGLEPALAGGLDWRWRFAGNTYTFEGQGAGSRAGEAGDRKDGWGTDVKVSKDAGKFHGNLGFRAFSPEFRVNDLGYLRRNDWTIGYGTIGFEKEDKPFGPFRSIELHLTDQYAQNFRNEKLLREKDLDVEFSTRNFWYFGGGGGRDDQIYDDRVTRGGPVTLNPVSHFGYGWITSDSRKRVMVSPSVSAWRCRDQSHGGEATVTASLNLASNVKLSFSPGYTWGMLRKLWVTNVDEDGNGTYDHFVFGDLKERILDLTTRADLTLSPSLSFQLYAQPYLAVGHYERFDELLVPKTYLYAPYDLGYFPDFNDKSLRGNAVLRWEYRPGSTLYLVWSQDRYEGSDNLGDFSPRRDLSTLMRTQGENVFMMKVNYWFNL
jgi:Domain of unknown function (DUF5916)